ncbi:MAG: hypothetical protein CME06_09465 [Gemmatimonadetes bacterium]|nr:hypothetical protein [Gemmatimonadota bacterium]
MIAQALLVSSLIASTPTFVVRPGDGQVARILMADAPGAHIYDLSGRRIRSSLGVGAAGDLLWKGLDDRERPVPAGVYLAVGASSPAPQDADFWTRCAPDPAIDLGAPGCFDEADIWGACVLDHNDTLKVWYTGFDGLPYGPTRIGFTYSTDQGATWARSCEPALSEGSIGSFDGGGVAAPYVIEDDAGALILFYGGFDGAVSQIGRAISADGGRSFERSPPLPIFSGQTSWSNLTLFKSVDLRDGDYTMWFVGLKDSTEVPWKVGRAISPDGIFWSTSPSTPVFTGSDPWEDFGTPSLDVEWRDDEWLMWYAATDDSTLRIGNAHSADGIDWFRNPANPLLDVGEEGDWDGRDVAEPAVLYAGAERILYHAGRDTALVGRVGCKTQPATSVSGSPPRGPAAVRLLPATPNPFNPRTTIRVEIDVEGDARLAVFDVAGRQVRVLHEGRLRSGTHSFVWDGRGRSGLPVASGIYLTVLEARGAREVRRIVLLK